MKDKKAQVWLETVVYTLIGLALIGVALAIITPKLTESKERAIIQQSMDALNVLDKQIKETIDFGPGNVRIIEEFGIKRGELIIDSENDSISFVVNELKKPYSEPGIQIEYGNILLQTDKKQKSYTTNLFLNYSSVVNITYGSQRKDILKKFVVSAKPYQFTITNYGMQGGKTNINIQDTTVG